MTAPRTPHRRSSGAIRKLSSGRYQARYTGPDGLLRSLGTFATKTEADQVLAHETSQMARGTWRDLRLGDEPLGAWFRDWLATRGDLADSTHELYGRLIDHWIDAPVQVARATGH
ncbi:MAG: hypothetical protein H7269_04700, partial [Cellulomonas sp.]|nr:hypothetical protein [Cellulomonas sp.]